MVSDNYATTGDTTMLTALGKSDEADFAVEREWIRSPPETVKDDSSLPNLEADARRFGEPHAARYLFNSTQKKFRSAVYTNRL